MKKRPSAVVSDKPSSVAPFGLRGDGTVDRPSLSPACRCSVAVGTLTHMDDGSLKEHIPALY